MTGHVTQADVAKRAGVHATTVSLALRNHPSLPQETRARIQKLAEEMGYRPDPALQALLAYRRGRVGSRRTSTLAYITNTHTRLGWQESPAHAEFFAGASSRAQKLGYQVEHFWLSEPGISHQRLSDILIARGISGLIVASHRFDQDLELAFDWSKFCAVKIDFAPHKPELHNVTNDQTSMIKQAMVQIKCAGYRRVGLVMPEWWDTCVNSAWSAGFLTSQYAFASEDRIPMLVYPTPSPGPDWKKRGEAIVPSSLFQRWLRQHRPDVLLSYQPFVWSRLVEMGLQVPRDIAFVDLFLINTDGKTAGLRQNCLRVGEVAVEILAGQLQQSAFGIPTFRTATLVDGTWFDGDTLPNCAAHTQPAIANA